MLPTGGGKSLCYQLPALLRGGTGVVVSPLIALMKDQVDALRARGVEAGLLNSHLSLGEKRTFLEKFMANEFEIVLITPERFQSQPFLDALANVDVRLFAVDEAHCVSQWGHNFRVDYGRLGHARSLLGNPPPPTVALTATATPAVQEDIIASLGISNARKFILGVDRPNLVMAIKDINVGTSPNIWAATKYINEQKMKSVSSLVAMSPALVYCGTRASVEEVTEYLKEKGIDAGMYHAGLDSEERTSVQNKFISGELDVVVATNAFGMGIDKADIRTLIHFQIPGTIEAYSQEIGRAGRDGKPSRTILLYSANDRNLQVTFSISRYRKSSVL